LYIINNDKIFVDQGGF